MFFTRQSEAIIISQKTSSLGLHDCWECVNFSYEKDTNAGVCKKRCEEYFKSKVLCPNFESEGDEYYGDN